MLEVETEPVAAITRWEDDLSLVGSGDGLLGRFDRRDADAVTQRFSQKIHKLEQI